MITAANVPSAPGKANEAQTPGDGCFVSHMTLSKDVKSSSGNKIAYTKKGEKSGVKLTID